MPPPYRCHVFVCTNRRPDGSPKGCCASKGGEEVRIALKHELDAAGVDATRINAAGCLDACSDGVAVVIYPEGVWYRAVNVADARDIVRSHLVEGRPVERLLLRRSGQSSAG